jgi:hypothetical protein
LDADLGGSGLPTGLDGINVATSVTIQTLTSGDITMIGRSGNGNESGVMGYNDAAGTIINAAGALSITGYSNSISNSVTRGFRLSGTYTANDDITLIGQDDTGDDATLSGARITSVNGGIDIFANTPGYSFYIGSTNTLTAKNDIRILADRIYLGTIAFNTDGQVKFLPRTGSSAFSVPLTIGTGVTFDAGITGLTIGVPTNTADITIGSSTTIAGPVTLFGGAVSVNSPLTATNSTISITSSSSIIDGASGYLIANGLALNGAGTVTLDHVKQ